MSLFQYPQFARDLKSGEEGAVDDLLRAAFEGEDEIKLIHSLRKAGTMAGETVLPMADQIVGYYALSRLRAPKGWLALAPVAIHPDIQGHGHGKRMVGMLTEWARLTQCPVVVVGQPEFYAKAGFSRERAAELTSPYPIENIMIAGLGKLCPEGKLVYSSAFDGI